MFQDLESWTCRNTVVLPKLLSVATIVVFFNEKTTGTICFQVKICLSGNCVCLVVVVLVKVCRSTKFFKYGKLIEKVISWL